MLIMVDLKGSYRSIECLYPHCSGKRAVSKCSSKQTWSRLTAKDWSIRDIDALGNKRLVNARQVESRWLTATCDLKRGIVVTGRYAVSKCSPS
jgi:hypothetical protein